MSNSIKTAVQIKSQIIRFSAKISQDLDKPKKIYPPDDLRHPGQ